jgi:hypothetical protein
MGIRLADADSGCGRRALDGASASAGLMEDGHAAIKNISKEVEEGVTPY